MDVDVDHYLVLGLPSGEEGAKLSVDDIKKAYRSKALELHPDKRPGNKQALADFQKLQTSYEILKDEKARKLFDDLLRVKREQQRRQSERSSKRDAKRQKMVSDLEEREQAAFAPDPTAKEREEEERIAKKLREEIARIRAMHTNKGANMASATSRESSGVRKEDMDTTGARVDKEKVLKVSWEKVGEDYTAEGLRELFSKFGEVDDVVIKSSKKKGSALVVMATKDAAVAATGSVCGHLSNPLLVLPLQPPKAAETSSAPRSTEPDRLSSLVGPGYAAFEDTVLMKLQKAAQKQN
ncbi:uncharacterized protein LOC133851027 [Alnus glutinosa]|uniref:uncharacterized protein LOC133851027 n=1 Tax=Alnus glutinosa TaxID=3517 RepID=UPI002D76D2C7|nr:uncharacterized protein LOC133851027 [Alnus glutinosa]XP_062143313.1 uncharacterized protein LOC133851027 [Alnus glutinosa]XP_062143320.1 uncharacterized protein LOC133851027 [Alnus glutinosa]